EETDMRILGIDLGHTSIKAVELDSTFGRYEIHEYHEQKVGLEEDPIEVAARLVQGLPKQPDRISVALPSIKTTFRNLQFPTKDKRAIQSGVNFEIEDELPFDIDNTVFHYSILS